MTIQPFTPQEQATINPLRYPESFECEYGPVRQEVLDFIEQTTNQTELSGGMVGQRFEW